MALASESTHWYKADGSPCYTQENKSKGGTRPTTLSDARKQLLRVSVSTILKVANAPALNRWIQNQMMLAFITLPKIEGESLQVLEARLWEDANAHSKMARERGTEIHNRIESGFLDPDSTDPYFLAVKKLLDEMYPDHVWSAEKSFSTKTYGGKVDLHGTKPDGSHPVVADYKVKEYEDDKKASSMLYDEHSMQLSAYAHGLGFGEDAERVNIFVRPEECGGIAVKHHVHTNDGKHWKMFQCLLNYWMISNNYYCESLGE